MDDRIDIAVDRLPEQRMKTRGRACQMHGDVHHRMIARRAFRDASVKIRALGVEQALAAISATEVRGTELNRKSIGIRRHAAHHEARSRPVRGQARRLTGRRDR